MKENLPDGQIKGENVDRVIAQFGKLPSEEVQQKIRAELQKQRANFNDRERIRDFERQRHRGRGR